MSRVALAQQATLSAATWIPPELARRSFPEVQTFLPTVTGSRSCGPMVVWPPGPRGFVDVRRRWPARR